MGARTRRVAASVVAAFLGGAVVLGLGPTAALPAAGAATCTSGGGVSVVVDYRELGGGVTTACAADGAGKSATAIVGSVGVSLTYAQRQPGFVCRVNGVPASDPCQNASPADAYWGLWWSDGTSGSWTYSSYSSGSLTVPAGGSVGWAWKQGSGNAAPPGVAPPVNATTSPTSSPTSSPTPSPSSTPTSSPSSSPSSGSGSGGNPGGGSGNGPRGGSPSSPSPSSGSSPESSSPSSSPSASASSAPSESPLASESPGDSRSPAGSGERKKKRSGDRESPGDSPASDADAPAAQTPESPEDSPASDAPAAGEPTTNGPMKVPAAVTWGAVGLLGAAVAVSALVARRRREPSAS